MFCGAALTFPNSGYGLLVVAMFRMVIVVAAGWGRGSCAQVLRNSRLSPASGRLREIGTPKCRFWRHCACQFGDTISDDNIGANCHWLMWLFASWFSDNLAGWFHSYWVVNICVIEYYDDSVLRITCQVVCFFMGPGRVVIISCMLY